MPTFDQVHEPARVLLGDLELKVLDLGSKKVWPLHGPGGSPAVCNPTVAGIAVKNLDATVMEPATAPVTVNWGDGVTEVVTPVGGVLKACHIYAKPGVRTVTLSDGVVKSQKVNAGVVPATTQQLVHGYDGNTPQLVYQGDTYLASTAPASWGEKTPFCDGVLRLHTFLGPAVSPPQVELALDVSFGGEWWNVSGNVLGDISLGGAAMGQTSDPNDYRIFAQAYLPGVHSRAEVEAAYPDGVYLPGTSVNFLNADSTNLLVSWVLSDDNPPKLMLCSLATQTVLNSIGLLGDADTGLFPVMAWPPGFDASMVPTLWVT
jgi:hypothetical protein